MKKLLLLTVLFLGTCFISRASDATEKFDSILEELESSEGVESVRLAPKKMLSLISAKNRGTDEKLFSKMDDLRVLSVTRTKSPSAYDRIRDAVKDYVRDCGMDQVLKLKEDSGEVLEMFHKDNELIFVTFSESEYTIIYISGTIDSELMQAVIAGKISFK